ncbi:MAG: TolC family protein, partial [Cyanobacteriota bacterium]
MAFRKRALALVLTANLSTSVATVAAPLTTQLNAAQSNELLERSWQRLDAELRALDQLLPSDPQPPVDDLLSTPQLPANLIRANQPATGPIQPADSVAAPPLDLPTPQQLQQGSIAGLSLEQALAIAFANSTS